jgi:hypothetical protein
MINLIKRQIYLDASWIKPKTLVNLRWLAIVGQGVAIAVTDLVLGLTFNVEACLTIIIFSCIVNLGSSIYFGTQKRLTAFKTFLFLSFDLIQISLLLFFFWWNKQSLFNAYNCTSYCICIFATNNLSYCSWYNDIFMHIAIEL